MCQWNSDFPSCPATIIKLKATLPWKVAEALEQDAVQAVWEDKWLPDRRPSSTNALGWGRAGPGSLLRLLPPGKLEIHPVGRWDPRRENLSLGHC